MIADVIEVNLDYILDIKRQLEKESFATTLIKEGIMTDAEIARQLDVSPFVVEYARKNLSNKKT